MFDFPDADKNTIYVGENEIAWVQGRFEGWTIFRVCDINRVEDEKLTHFLAFSSIYLKHQKE